MLVGLHAEETVLPVNTAIRQEATLTGVFAYTPTDFQTALDWLATRRIGLQTGVVEASLEDGPSGIADW